MGAKRRRSGGAFHAPPARQKLHNSRKGRHLCQTSKEPIALKLFFSAPSENPPPGEPPRIGPRSPSSATHTCASASPPTPSSPPPQPSISATRSKTSKNQPKPSAKIAST